MLLLVEKFNNQDENSKYNSIETIYLYLNSNLHTVSICDVRIRDRAKGSVHKTSTVKSTVFI